jgi:hypothetical protein
MSEPAERILVLCPTARDRVHLSRPEIRSVYPLEFRGTDEETHEPGFDAVRFVEGTIRAVKKRRGAYRAVVGFDDFPASMMAALVGEAVGLPAPSFESLFLCQHKYYSRLRQREAVPEATPRFHVLDLSRDGAPSDLPLSLPVFVKPVKSYLSILARPIATLPELARIVEEARRRLAGIAAMFDGLVAASRLDRAFRAVPGAALLAEEVLGGHQVTLDGYAFNGEVVPLGVVDSFFFLRSSSFERFEYPSRLPAPVQERMARLAERCVRAVGLDRTFFNIEFFHREKDDAVHLIEVNGRMSSQFAPLYRMVDGIDLYAMQLEMALGREPGGREVWGPGRRRGRVAASFVLRTFEDGLVRRVPAAEEVAGLAGQFPEAFIEILVREGAKLSDELQDDESYRYALVDLCAKDRKELRKKFEEAKGLLPFAFEPIPPAR